jgi:hypothetical protein
MSAVAPSTQINFLKTLPEELIPRLLTFLDGRAIAVLMGVSKNETLKNPINWQEAARQMSMKGRSVNAGQYSSQLPDQQLASYIEAFSPLFQSSK